MKPKFKWVKEVNDDGDGFEINVSLVDTGENVGNVTVNIHYELEFLFGAYEDKPYYNDLVDNDAVAEIVSLSIEDKFQGQGVAKYIMNLALKEIHKKYPKLPIFVNASPMGSSGLRFSDLINFYKRFGFKVLGRFPEHKNAALIMKNQSDIKVVEDDESILEDNKNDSSKILALENKNLVVNKMELFSCRKLIDEGKGDEYYNQLPDGELKEFYDLCRRDEWEEEYREAAKEEWDALTDEEKMEEYGRLRSEGYSDLDPKYWKKKSKEEKLQALEGYYIDEYVKYAEDQEGSSTETFFSNPRIGRNVVVTRFTNTPPEEMLKTGFTYGYGPENLGLTFHYRPSANGNLLFGVATQELKNNADWKSWSDKYGKYGYSFRVPWAVKAYHHTDDEEQVVFDYETVSDLKSVWPKNKNEESEDDEGRDLKGQEYLDFIQKKMDKVEAKEDEIIGAGARPIAFRGRSKDKIVFISKSFEYKDGWRITIFIKGVPYSHTDYKSFDVAVRDADSNGADLWSEVDYESVTESFSVNKIKSSTKDKKYNASVKGAFDMLSKGKAFIPEALGDWKKIGIVFSHKEEPEQFRGIRTGNVLHRITATDPKIDMDVAHFEFFYWGEEGRHNGSLDVQSSNVAEDYQRLGIATEAYSMIEKIVGAKLNRTGSTQTMAAKKLWSQPNRPFGEAKDQLAYHVTLKKNLSKIKRKGLIPGIGDRSSSLGEETPAVYLFPDKVSVEDALMNWLGDEFEDEEIVILEVDISGLEQSSEAFEIQVFEKIDPSRIVRVIDEDDLNESDDGMIKESDVGSKIYEYQLRDELQVLKYSFNKDFDLYRGEEKRNEEIKDFALRISNTINHFIETDRYELAEVDSLVKEIYQWAMSNEEYIRSRKKAKQERFAKALMSSLKLIKKMIPVKESLDEGIVDNLKMIMMATALGIAVSSSVAKACDSVDQCSIPTKDLSSINKVVNEIASHGAKVQNLGKDSYSIKIGGFTINGKLSDGKWKNSMSGASSNKEDRANAEDALDALNSFSQGLGESSLQEAEQPFVDIMSLRLIIGSVIEYDDEGEMKYATIITDPKYGTPYYYDSNESGVPTGTEILSLLVLGSFPARKLSYYKRLKKKNVKGYSWALTGHLNFDAVQLPLKDRRFDLFVSEAPQDAQEALKLQNEEGQAKMVAKFADHLEVGGNPNSFIGG